jgi:iron only hydrogenase large subunit-like protein
VQVTEGFSQIDPELCTGCQSCTETCPADAISGEKRTPQTVSEERCVGCGRCVQVCSAYDTIFQERPTSRARRLEQRNLPASLVEPLFAAHDHCNIAKVRAALANPDLVILAQYGPAVSGALAEDFGLPAGSISTGRILAAMKKLGFKKIYSFTLPAALAVLEEAHEFVDRLQSGRILPVINSSCPAAVKFIEQAHPELIHYIAGCKSPHQIAGTLLKSYVAETLKLDAKQIYSVSVGPCTSRKFESRRPEMTTAGFPNVDAVLTTRELAWMIKDSGMDPISLPEESFDVELPAVDGMETVYCVPGDITASVLQVSRGMLDPHSGETPALQLSETGVEGVRTAAVSLNSFSIKVATVMGLPAAAPFFEAMKSGKNEIAFLELLACPMGCVSGGGQPKVLLPQEKDSAYAERAKLSAGPDSACLSAIAQHPAVQRIYKDYFGKACGDSSNHALRTQYVERKLNP